MKPINLQTDISQLLNDKSLLLLNRDAVAIRYITQLVALKSTIQTKGGRSLPIELWHLILEHASVDKSDSFCIVQAVSLQDQRQIKVLQCRAIKWQSTSCGRIESSREVLEYEQFMAKPSEGSDHKLFHPVEPANGDENKFDIFFTPAGDDLPMWTTCIYFDLTIPDIICHIEDGKCQFCAGVRHICPEETYRDSGFDTFSGTSMPLACPVCMGWDFCQKHKEFIDIFYDNCPRKKDTIRLGEWLHQRLDEFGYEWKEDGKPLALVLDWWLQCCECEDWWEDEWSPTAEGE